MLHGAVFSQRLTVSFREKTWELSKVIGVLNPASPVEEQSWCYFKITTNHPDSGELLTINVKGMKYQKGRGNCCFFFFYPAWKWIPYEDVLLELASAVLGLTFVRKQGRLHNNTVSTPAGCPFILAPPLSSLPRPSRLCPSPREHVNSSPS